jgi:polyphosphate glucokinase
LSNSLRPLCPELFMSRLKNNTAPKVLMIDVGGTNAKCMASGQEGLIKIPTGQKFTPKKLVREVLKGTEDWDFDAITLGYPGLVRDGKPAREPSNLGNGWVKFDYQKAFRKPVRIINDAAMQALASYESGRMLFVGFGTSIGCALIVDDVVIPLEVGLLHLPSGRTFIEKLEDRRLKRYGRKKWMRRVESAVEILRALFHPDDIVLGGGNAKHIDPLPKGCRIRENHTAFLGAARLWPGADILVESYGTSWRIKKPPTNLPSKVSRGVRPRQASARSIQ